MIWESVTTWNISIMYRSVKLYELIVNAKAAVLIPGHTALWWTNFAKMVDYIALQVPVLAMVPID